MLDRTFETTRLFLQRKARVSELYNQAKEDLVEEAGGGSCDKGTETGVKGIDGALPSSKEFATSGYSKGYAGVDA